MKKTIEQRNKTICFYGPDGAGKTTIAIGLEYLLNKRMRVRRVWVRGTHLLLSILARILARFKSFKGRDNPYYGLRIPRKIVKLWVFLELVNFIPVYMGRYIAPRIMGYTVVGERGVADFIAWIILTTRNPRFLNTLAGRFLVSLALRDNCIYVYSEPAILYARRSDEISLHDAIKQVITYNKLAELLGSRSINTGDMSLKETIKKILRLSLLKQ